MRLVDADALKEEVKTMFCPDGYKIMMLERIDNAPTVAEDYDTGYQDGLEDGLNDIRLQGEWIVFYTPKKKKVFKCDKCMAVSIQGQTNFCPNCGTDMRGAE